MALNSLYSMIGNVGNAVPNQSPTQTTEQDPMQMLAPLMKGLEGAGAGNRQQADNYRQQARDTSQQAYGMQAPEPTAPAFRTADAIGLGLLALMSGRHFDKALAGYLGAKNQKAEQDTQAALQSFGMKQKAMLNSAQNFGGMADDADARAAQEERLAQAKFGTAATFLGGQLNNQRTVEGAGQRAQVGAEAGIEKAKIGAEARLKTEELKTQAAKDRDQAKMFGQLSKMTPEGRRAWGLANGLDEQTANALGAASPSELLSKARAAKIPAEVAALRSKVALDGVKAKQIVEATRFIGPSFDLKRQRLATDIANITNLMDARNANIEIRKEALAKGAASINNARTTASKILNTATIELGRLQKLDKPTDDQKQRMSELQSAIDANTQILTDINVAAGLVKPVDPNQLFGGIMGEVPPMPVGPTGLTAGLPPRTGPIGGQSPKAATKPIKVKASRPGLKITNIRVSG